MLITLDIKNESMKDSFLNFIKTLDYIDIKNDNKENTKVSVDNKDKFIQFAGMWENNDISLESIRENAWKR